MLAVGDSGAQFRWSAKGLTLRLNDEASVGDLSCTREHDYGSVVPAREALVGHEEMFSF